MRILRASAHHREGIIWGNFIFLAILLRPEKKRCLIGITQPTLYPADPTLHIFINFSKTKNKKQKTKIIITINFKKGFFSKLSFSVMHVCAGGYHHWCLRFYFQTSNQKSVLKNKWLNPSFLVICNPATIKSQWKCWPECRSHFVIIVILGKCVDHDTRNCQIHE